MSDLDPVIFEFQAKVNGYLSDLSKTTRSVDQNLGRQEARIRQLEGEFRRSSGAISGHLRSLTGALGAAFTVRGAQTLIDNFTRLQNQLRVAGLEGDKLAGVQSRLLDIGTKYGVSVNSLGDLYGKASQAQSDLGATSEQLLTITQATAEALKITGTSTQAASGAILGLTQALSSGIVRAEEFNQINEGGLRPLLQLVANSDRFGGSIAKLRVAVADGKVTSQEFYQAILALAAQLEGKATKATLTLEGAFTSLNNKLIEYVGGAAQTNGATAALSAGIQGLANNLDTIIPLIATIATYLGVRYVVGAAAATTGSVALSNAVFAMQARMAGAATTAEALGFALNGLKLGLAAVAITALVAGFAYLASEQQKAEAATADLAASIAEQKSEFAGLHEQQKRTSLETDNLTSAQRAALVSTANLTGEAHLLASAWARVAAEAKKAAIEQTYARVQTAKTNYQRARTAFETKETSLAEAASGIVPGRGMSGSFPSPAEGRRIAAGKMANSPELRQLQDATQNLQDATGEFVATVGRDLKGFNASPKAAGANAKKKGGGAGRAGGSGPSASEIQDRYLSELSSLQDEELRARIAITTNAEDRAVLAKDALAAERAERVRQIENNAAYSAAQKTALIATLNSIYGTPGVTDPKTGAIVAEARPGLLAQGINRDQEREALARQEDMARLEIDALSAEADIADSRAERARIEAAILKTQQDIARQNLEQQIADGEITDAKKARADLERKLAADRTRSEQSNEGPLAAYYRRLNRSDEARNEEIESAVVGELEAVRDSIHNAISKTLGIKDPLISQLLDFLIEDVLIKPIAAALAKQSSGGGGFLKTLFGIGASALSGGASSGISSGASNFASNFAGARASGGSVLGGQMYRVNEGASPGRVEGFIPQGSGQIVPLGRKNAATGRGMTLHQTINIDTRGSVNPDGYAEHIKASVRQETLAIVGQGMSQVNKGIPQRMSQYQRDGN